MIAQDLLRNLTLTIPVLVVWAAAGVTNPCRAHISGATLGFLAAFTGIMLFEVATSWWLFAWSPTNVLGIPMEAAVGWALVWGALPGLSGGPVWLWIAGFAWIDFLLMPSLTPLVHLGPTWWQGELLMLGCVATPSCALALWSRERTHLYGRAALQMTTFAALVLVLTPTLAFQRDGLAWSELAEHHLAVRTALLIVACGFAVPAAAAVWELAQVGRGTPWPWDPPERLVTTGPYAYLANPMQVSTIGLLSLLAIASKSPTLAIGTAIAIAFSMALAEPHERQSLTRAWPNYRAYRERVHNWWPRWQPYVGTPSEMYVSQTCSLCRALGGSLEALEPQSMRVSPAETAPFHVTRMTWQGPVVDVGIRALGRGLEQTNLIAAWWGWMLRLPLIADALQVILDACGLGPRDVKEVP